MYTEFFSIFQGEIWLIRVVAKHFAIEPELDSQGICQKVQCVMEMCPVNDIVRCDKIRPEIWRKVHGSNFLAIFPSSK